MMMVVNRWHRLGLLGWLVLAVALLPTTTGAQNLWAQYNNFTAISAIAESGRFLWAGTHGGLVRLDKTTGEKVYFDRFNSTLADSRILHMDSDAKGRLAAITRMGVFVEFDGATWLNAGASTAFQGQYPFDLAWNAEGVLFVLTFDRLTRQPALFIRRGGQWTRVALDGAGTVSASGSSVYGLTHQGVFGPYGSLIPYLQVDEQGKALVLTAGYNWMKLFRIDSDGAVDTLPIPTHLGPRLYIQPKSGSPYWLCYRKLAKPSSDGWDTIPLPQDGFDLPTAHPRHLIARMPDGTEYWSFRQLYKYRDGAWAVESIPGDLNPYSPLHILASSDTTSTGTPSLFTARGDRVGSLKGHDWNVTDISRKPLGLGTGFFHSIHPRRSNSSEILLARENGIEVLDARSFQSTPLKLDNTSGTPPPAIYGVAEAPDRKIWVMTSAGITHLNLGDPQGPFILKADWENPSYTRSGSDYFTTDTAGIFWMAAKGRLIAIPEGNTDSSTWTSHWLPGARDRSANVFSLSAHPDGSIWFATYVGSNPDEPSMMQLGRYDGRAWKMFNASHHSWLGRFSVPSIQCDRAGNVWASFPEGLLQWDGSIWKEHARGSSSLFAKGFDAIAADPNGRLWAATTQPNAMLLRWEGQWVPVTESREVMATNQVESMRFDANGRLWMATRYDGVFVYDPNGSLTTHIHAVRTGRGMNSTPGMNNPLPIIRRNQAMRRWELWPIQTQGARSFDLQGRQLRLK